MTHFVRYAMVGVMVAGASYCAHAQDDDLDALLSDLVAEEPAIEQQEPQAEPAPADPAAPEVAELPEEPAPVEEEVAEVAEEPAPEIPAEEVAEVPAEEPAPAPAPEVAAEEPEAQADDLDALLNDMAAEEPAPT